MSRIINKKINKTPIRSPSPDIANRNIITRTNSPINQAMNILRLSKSSKNPLGRSFLNTEEYQAYIKELQQKNRLLTQDNRILYQQTMRQTKQIDFMKETNLKHRKQIYKKNDSQINYPQIQYSPDILTEYEMRINLMSQQVKRIHELLASQKRRNQNLQEENYHLRSKEIKDKDKDKKVDPKLKKELQEIQESLITSFDKLLNQYQNKVDMVIRDQIQKVNQVQKNQRNILRIIQNGKKYESPSIDKLLKNRQSSTFYRSPIVESRYDKSNSQSQQIQCFNCKLYLLKISDYQSKILELQKIIKEKSKIKEITKDPSNQQLEFYLQKLEQIKMILTNQQIIDSINIIEQNLTDIYSIDEKFQFMKQQKNNIIQELRQKQVQNALQISALKKERQMMKVEIKQQTIEIQKLKELLSMSLKSLKKQQNNINNTKKSNVDGKIVRKYIQQAVLRIDNLQQQIQKDINL